MGAFLAGFYGLLAAGTLTYFERKYPRGDWWRAKALDRTIDTVNFTNAVLATLLSSWALLSLDRTERINVRGGKASQLAGWTVQSVCGYIVVEISVLLLSRYRLTTQFWKLAVDSYKGMVVFHVVALVGLVSVMTLDAGYPLALWVIWSELTSVFLGLESFLQNIGVSRSHAKEFFVLEVGSTLMFVFQRVLLFDYLLWVCWDQFSWEVGFVLQFAILVAGTALNSVSAMDRVVETKQSWNWCRSRVWS